MKVIDLFSGIGGFSLGLESTGGFETVQFVENNEWCQKVLAKNFPGVPITGDIKNYEPKKSDGIGLVCGGFPCQPFSVAGKRKGTEDDRHLWPEMLRVIKSVKPKYIIGENVRNLTSIQDGMVFEQVCTDLENEGYEVQSFIIPASAVNAPHQRYRVWIVAYSDSIGNQSILREKISRRKDTETSDTKSSGRGDRRNTISSASRDERQSTNVADSESIKPREQTEWKRGKDTERGSDDSRGIKEKRSANVAYSDSKGLQGHRESSNRINEETITTTNSKGRSEGMDHKRFSVEPRVGRVAHGIPHRVDRIKGLGNAIVPQIVYQIGLAILESEKTNA
mgnify:FL=1